MNERSAVLAFSVVFAAGCGKIEKLEQPLRPSVDVFAAQTQPVFERQGCSRSQCHGKVPEGVGGLKLTSSDKVIAEDVDVLANYAAATAFIDLGDPEKSVLIRAPFLGTGGEVDHPEYYGRFSTSTDCCYCSVLLWICEESTPEACEACRKTAAPDCECSAASFCEIDDDGEVTPAAGASLTWLQSVGPLLLQETTCGTAGCHGLKGDPVCPILADPTTIDRQDNPCNPDDEDAWLTPCIPGGGTFVQYALGVGRGANEIHAGLLNAAAASTVTQWVIDLGAPLGVAGPPVGPNPDPDPGPDPEPEYICDPNSPSPNPDVSFEVVKGYMKVGGCADANCHGEGATQPFVLDRPALVTAGAVVVCEGTSPLIVEATIGKQTKPVHENRQKGWGSMSQQVKDITRWIVDLGAPP